MSLQDQQRLLAQLLTDANVRERWLENPSQAGNALALSPEDVTALASLPAPLLQRQAQALLSKRRLELKKLLPLTFRCLGPHGEFLHDHFAQHFFPDGFNPHRSEALAFAHWLAKTSKLAELPPERIPAPEAVSLARYEATLLAGYVPGRWGGWLRVPLRIQAWQAGLTSTQLSVEQLRQELRPGSSWMFWCRLGRTGILRRWIF